jgi:TonB-dependent starch-binding outer membrane protein SusC
MKINLLKCLTMQHRLLGLLLRNPVKLLLMIMISGFEIHAGTENKVERKIFVFQNSTVQGTIISQSGAPLPGVNILEKGTTNGTTTDSDGKYALVVSGNDAVLVFSFIGFVTQEVAINGQSVIDITLGEDVLSLDEIVVVGYSTQEKKDITGSVGVVNTEALKSIPTGSASQALQGLASGVTVISSGAPGGRNDIFIRGVTSFGNTQPLILVD